MTRAIVYKNLTRGDWSIAAPSGRDGTGRGKVTGHAASLTLANVSFIVKESARLRVERTKSREVHAWAIGDIVDTAPPSDLPAREISYNPYRCGAFTYRDNGAPVAAARFVTFRSDQTALAHGD